MSPTTSFKSLYLIVLEVYRRKVGENSLVIEEKMVKENWDLELGKITSRAQPDS